MATPKSRTNRHDVTLELFTDLDYHANEIHPNEPMAPSNRSSFESYTKSYNTE